MKILVGYDGSECADAALDDLALAGLPEIVEVSILSVAEFWFPPPPPSSLEILEEARRAGSAAELQHELAKRSDAYKESLASAKRAGARLQSRYRDWKISADASCGSAAWELIAKADEWKPDLMLVGSHGRSTLGRFVLGSVSQRVLTEAKCSVRVARGRVEEPGTPLRIIVAVDGSPASKEALSTVAERRWPSGTVVKVVFAQSPLVPQMWGSIVPAFGKMIDEDLKEDRAWIEKLAKDDVERTRSAGIKVICVVREGDPQKELPKAAEEWGADCIFLGSVGFSNRFERFVLGSVSGSVAARAHCSVEVVRPRQG